MVVVAVVVPNKIVFFEECQGARAIVEEIIGHSEQVFLSLGLQTV